MTPKPGTVVSVPEPAEAPAPADPKSLLFTFTAPNGATHTATTPTYRVMTSFGVQRRSEMKGDDAAMAYAFSRLFEGNAAALDALDELDADEMVTHLVEPFGVHVQQVFGASPGESSAR